jgi:hypothetical protein
MPIREQFPEFDEAVARTVMRVDMSRHRPLVEVDEWPPRGCSSGAIDQHAGRSRAASRSRNLDGTGSESGGAGAE